MTSFIDFMNSKLEVIINTRFLNYHYADDLVIVTVIGYLLRSLEVTKRGQSSRVRGQVNKSSPWLQALCSCHGIFGDTRRHNNVRSMTSRAARRKGALRRSRPVNCRRPVGRDVIRTSHIQKLSNNNKYTELILTTH